MGRLPGWAAALTGRAVMLSPGRPPVRRDLERAFWVQIARGLYADATGDSGQAEELLEDALRFFLASRAPLEAARGRIELGRLLVGRGAQSRATRELEAARDALSLGVSR